MDDLALALRLADIADAVAMGRFRAADLEILTKPDGTHVSDADTAVEVAVREELSRHRPDDEVLGEEQGGPLHPGGRRWIIDPIDGTTAYSEGRDVWGFLAGLEVDGRLTVGVVSAPAMGRRFWAADGQGAWGGRVDSPRRQRVSTATELTGSQATFALPPAMLAPAAGPGLLDLAKRVRHERGEAALAVTTGRSDFGIKSAGGPWDLAAFVVIVREAGGRYSDRHGGDRIDLPIGVVSNGILHEEVLRALSGEGAPV